MSAFFKVSHLHISYGSIHAVKGVSFDIHKGEIVSLIGCNGAGKTSTLRAISGVIESSGDILFKGENLQKVPAYDRVKLGLGQSPEGRGVFAQMSVLENLQLGAYSRKGSVRDDLDFCFELFPRLKERISQAAGTLSGGEQQMLAISRALMSQPELLLLDEPSLGLAPIIVSQIFEIILKLNQKKGMTILLVEQNARQALKISHRSYVLETGLVFKSGTGNELLNDPEVQKAYLGL